MKCTFKNILHNLNNISTSVKFDNLFSFGSDELLATAAFIISLVSIKTIESENILFNFSDIAFKNQEVKVIELILALKFSKNWPLFSENSP